MRLRNLITQILTITVLAFNAAGGASPGGKTSSAVGSVFQKVFVAMTNYQKDPYKGVALLAKTVIEHFRVKAKELMSTNGLSEFEYNFKHACF